MDRKEWLRKLQMELYKLPRIEVDDALAYYTEYFEEAGPENEQEIIRELGNPSRVAAQIKADYAVRQLDDVKTYQENGQRKTRVGLIVAAVIAGIFAAPIALPLAVMLAGLVIGLVALIGGLIVGLIALAAGGIIGGLATFIGGLANIATSGAGALIIIGTGLALTGAGLLLAFLVVKLAGLILHAAAEALRKGRQKRQEKKYRKLQGTEIPVRVTAEPAVPAEEEVEEDA